MGTIKNKAFNYEAAVAELQAILQELEEGKEASFKGLKEKLQRSTELLEQCKKHLHEVNSEIEGIMKQLDE